MSEQMVTVALPAALYDHVKHRAEAGGRSVEDEIADTLRASLSEPYPLPNYLEEAIAPLARYTDEELWWAARSRFPDDDADTLEELHFKRGRGERLSEQEERKAEGLLRLADRIMLVRAKAAALLKERGHDVSVLLRAS